MTDEDYRLACLAAWIVDHNAGDGRRIAAWFERVEREGKPVAKTPGLRERVREEYRRRRVSTA